MADLNTVYAKVLDALNEVEAALGQPTISEQLAAKDAIIASLQTKIANAKTALE